MKNIFAAVIAAYCLLQVSGRTVKERLLNDLTDDYEPAIDPGVVDLQLSVYLMCSWIDDDSGFVFSHGWESYSWTDERLEWSPDEYGGLGSLQVPAKFVWTPDMREFRAVGTEIDRDEGVYVVLSSDGTVVWIPPVTYRSACTENEGKKNCDFRIGSWAYSGNAVRLAVQGSAGLDVSYYQDACPLAVESHTAQVVNHTYPCCEEPYPSMDISIVFNQRQ